MARLARSSSRFRDVALLGIGCAVMTGNERIWGLALEQISFHSYPESGMLPVGILHHPPYPIPVPFGYYE